MASQTDNSLESTQRVKGWAEEVIADCDRLLVRLANLNVDQATRHVSRTALQEERQTALSMYELMHKRELRLIGKEDTPQ